MKKVLLLDDARSIRETYAAVVKQAGYEVDMASNAEEAIQKIIADGVPDLIVTDVNMPGISGIEFCKRIRAAAKGVPIIVMSSESDKNMIVDAKKAGISGWMLKPVPPEIFYNKIRSLLGEPNHA